MNLDHSSYFASGPSDRSWGVTSTGVGRATVERGDVYPPMRHPVDHMFSWQDGRVLQAYQLLYISKGRGQFESGPTGILELGMGDLFLLFPGEWHRYKPDPEVGWVEDWIELSGETMERLQAMGTISPERPVYSVGLLPEILDTFDRCHELARTEPAEFTAMLGLLGLQLLAKATMVQAAPKESNLEIESCILRAKEIIGERIDRPVVMEVLAEEVGLPYWLFRRAFKVRTGLTPKQYQLQIRHRKAQDLLANTALPLQDIAQTLGFDTAFHLSADFKKRTGQAPDVWRSTYKSAYRQRKAE